MGQARGKQNIGNRRAREGSRFRRTLSRFLSGAFEETRETFYLSTESNFAAKNPGPDLGPAPRRGQKRASLP